MWIHYVQALMDILLLPGRVFILLMNIHLLPPEEAFLVVLMSLSLVAVAVGYIKEGIGVIFSKWMVPALLNPVAVYVMAAVSETARETFNNTTSYAPGLAFFSPFGVAVYALLLDFFARLFERSEPLEIDISFIRRTVTYDSGGGVVWSTKAVEEPVSRELGREALKAPAVETHREHQVSAVEKPATISEKTTHKPEVEMKVHRPRTPPRMPEPVDSEKQTLAISRRHRLPEEQ